MRSKIFVVAFASTLLIAFLPTSVHGQTTFGTILGTVSDTSGAVVPNVVVTITNQGENTSREVRSDAQGNYQAENLKAGIYTVTTQATGFSSVSVKDVHLEARQIVRTDLKLTVGGATEKVEVEAKAELINTESSTIASSFSSSEVLSLPANYRGAGSTSPYALLAFLPGVQGDTNGEISVQGAQPFQVEYTVDGISTASVRYSGPQREMFPSAENISEMKVQGAGDSAEYGQVGDITTTSKGGTNSFHGSVFEYFQNAALDAKPFGAVDKPAKSANTFGFSFSGPIFKNRTFFFVDYEGMRYRTQTTLHDKVPTEAMRNGDFRNLFYKDGRSVEIFDFDGFTPFPNNIIPPDRINRVAPIILRYYPLPNHFDPSIGGLDVLQDNNYVANVPNPILSNQFDIRIDHTINAKQNIFGRWTHNKRDITTATDLLLPQQADTDRQTQVVIAHNYAITPNLVNELRGGISRGTFEGDFPVDGPALMQELALNGLGPFPQGGFPQMVPGFGASSVTRINHGRPNDLLSSNFQINENLTWTKGKHTMKFGFDFRKLRLTNIWSSTTGDDYGDFWFNGQYTTDYYGGTPESGYDFADFLLGAPYYSDVTHTAPDIDGRTNHYYAYAEDTFKVTPKLTLNFGLRFSRLPPFVDPINHTNFDPSVPLTGRVVISSDPRSLQATNPLFLQNINACPNPDVVFPDGTTVPCTPFLTAHQAGWPEGLRETYSDWAPRFGFAYRPFSGNNTVIRGGAGVYTVTTLGTVFYSIAGVHDGYQASFLNGWTSSGPLLPLFTFPDVQTGTPLGLSLGTQRFETSNQFDKADPYTIQWNLTVEQTLHGNTALRVSYIGSRGLQLTWAPDLNQPRPSTTDFGSRPAGDFPFPVWSHIYSRAAGATSTYHSMQTELIHRYSNGLTLQSTWTWAHNLSDTASFTGSSFGGEAGEGRSLDRFNRGRDWGEVGGTRRHRWITTLLYELPIGRGRRFLGDANGLVDGLLGGWRVSTIALLQTGPYLTAWLPGDSSGTGSQASRTAGQRPDAFGNGNIDNPTPSDYWNPNVFACPGDAPGVWDCGGDTPIGRFGTSRVGNLIGPGTINISLGLAKDFRLSERATLKFESSFTNLPNHTNYNDPETNLNDSNFGKIFDDRGGDSGGTRVGQFALRIEF
ncbi:MAG TPA: TonB-dependent receptor [Terriglobales bacterium]|jgi:hypothetical protein